MIKDACQEFSNFESESCLNTCSSIEEDGQFYDVEFGIRPRVPARACITAPRPLSTFCMSSQSFRGVQDKLISRDEELSDSEDEGEDRRKR